MIFLVKKYIKQARKIALLTCVFSVLILIEVVLCFSQVLEYEYEPELEDSYRQNMFKSFKKTIDDGFFPFIIVDAVNEKVKHFEEFWSYAKSKGFQVALSDRYLPVLTCIYLPQLPVCTFTYLYLCLFFRCTLLR